jgi:fructose transport system ATP-binding protein
MCSRWPTASTSTGLASGLCVIKPSDYTMSDAVAFMTGAKLPEGVTEAA